MASGQSLIVFGPRANEPPASVPALFGTRNLRPILKFDDATNWSAIFSSILPRSYDGGGLTVYLHVSMTAATTGNTDWDASFERVGDQVLDIDTDSFAGVQSTDDTTVPGTSGLVDVIAIAFTDGAQMDSLLKGEQFRLKVTRDAVSDTASGYAEITKVEIKET